MRVVSSWLCVGLLCAGLAACAGDGRKRNNPSVNADDQLDGGDEEVCVDEDGDGYGPFCVGTGLDCDDKDPNVTDECVRCRTPHRDCPCDDDLPISCKPEDREADGGVWKCAEGTRWCRDGYWSDCEAAGDYVFFPTN
jgi:hypothetical protein